MEPLVRPIGLEDRRAQPLRAVRERRSPIPVGASCRLRQRHLLPAEQRPELLRLEQVPPTRRLARQLELAEHGTGLRSPGRLARPPLRRESVAQLQIAGRCLEEPPYDELRRDGPVPAVRLQPERDVLALGTAQTVELASLPERDPAGAHPVRRDGELQVIARRRPRRARTARRRGQAAADRGCRARTAPGARALHTGPASARRPTPPRRPRRAGGDRPRRAPTRRALRTHRRTPRLCPGRIERPAAARCPP